MTQAMNMFGDSSSKESDRKKVVVSEEDIDKFLKETGEYMISFFTQLENETDVRAISTMVYEPPTIINDFVLNPFYSDKVVLAKSIHGGWSQEFETGSFDLDIFNNYELGYSLRVIVTNDNTYVLLDGVQLPTHMRGKGIFTGLLKIVKKFLDEHGMEPLIGMIDSSEGDISSGEVVWKQGMDFDPFLTQHEGLEVEA